jgi:hypothetical protein
MISKTSLVYFFGLHCWAVFSVFGLLVSWACDVLLICTYLISSRYLDSLPFLPCHSYLSMFPVRTVIHAFDRSPCWGFILLVTKWHGRVGKGRV